MERHPYISMLDRAHTVRLALLDMPDVAAVCAALSALTGEECRMLVLELAMDAWWERHHGGEDPGA